MIGWLALAGNAFDFKAGELAAVAFGFMVAFAALEFKREHLGRAVLIDNLGGDFRPLDEWRANLVGFAVIEKENLLECGVVADIQIKAFDVDRVTFFYPVLFAASFENCVCHLAPPWISPLPE